MSTSTTVPNPNKSDWNQTTDDARKVAASVGEMASHAASAVGGMASQAACDVGKSADNLTARAGVGIQGVGDSISQHTPHSGMLGNASQAVANSVRHGGQYVEHAKLSGMSEDVAHLIRQNPITAVLIGIGLGWFVARNLRS